MAHVVVTGLDGRPKMWPVEAVSFKDGVYRDFKGRRVAAVGMDSADGGVVVRKAIKATANDGDAADHATLVATLLFPQVLQMVKSKRRNVGIDDARSQRAEQADLYGVPEAEDGQEISIADRIAAGYEAAKQFWKKASTRNRRQSQILAEAGRYSSPTAVSTKPTRTLEDNAEAARPFSAFQRF